MIGRHPPTPGEVLMRAGQELWVVDETGRFMRLTVGSSAWEQVLRSGRWQECERPAFDKKPSWNRRKTVLVWDGEAREIKRHIVHRAGLDTPRRAPRPRRGPGITLGAP